MPKTPLAHAQSAQIAIENIANSTTSPVYVTQPALPPLQEFIPYLEAIWASKILTNGDPFHQQHEKALCDYLGVPHLALLSNGTLAFSQAGRMRWMPPLCRTACMGLFKSSTCFPTRRAMRLFAALDA